MEISWPELWMVPLNLWNYPSQLLKTSEPFETEEEYLALLDKLKESHGKSRT
jgi:hypothetical protein